MLSLSYQSLLDSGPENWLNYISGMLLFLILPAISPSCDLQFILIIKKKVNRQRFRFLSPGGGGTNAIGMFNFINGSVAYWKKNWIKSAFCGLNTNV